MIDKFLSSVGAAVIEEVEELCSLLKNFPSMERGLGKKGQETQQEESVRCWRHDKLPGQNERLLPLKTEEPMWSSPLTGHTYTKARTEPLGERYGTETQACLP